MKRFSQCGAALLLSTSGAPPWVTSLIATRGVKSGRVRRCGVAPSTVSSSTSAVVGERDTAGIDSGGAPRRRAVGVSIMSSHQPDTEVSPPGGSGGDGSGAAWDAEAGVWVGEKAAGHDGDIPSPLWIFGYGSLCWRPEESFAGFERFDGEVVGWKRLFAQKSMDHRGTPESPGLVATLISDADLEALGERSAGDSPSRTHGVAYLVPDEKAEDVLAGLDFREKGGYTRATVDVFPARAPPKEDRGREVDNSESCHGDEGGGVGYPDDPVAPKRALLYTATTDNPNFHLSSAEETASTIAVAVGPSGPNRDYLFSLSEYLQKVGTPDPHLVELVDMVRSRIASEV